MSRNKTTTVSLTLFLALSGISILLMLYANPWAEKKLKKQLASLEQGPLKLSYSTLDIDLFSGHASIADVTLMQTRGKHRYRVSFKALDVAGLGIITYLLNKRIAFDLLKIREPNIEYIRVQEAGSGHQSGDSPNFPPVHVKSVRLNKGRFIIKNDTADIIRKQAGGRFNIAINDLRMSAPGTHQYNFFDAATLDILLHNITYNTADSLYKIGIKNIRYSSREKSIFLDSIRLGTRYKKFELANVVGHEKDWLDIHSRSIKITGVDPEEILHKKLYHAHRVTIENSDALIFRNKRVPFPEKPDTKLLTAAIAEVNVDFSVDTILIKNADIAYQELVKKGRQPGKLKFQEVYASVYNVTNIDSILAKNHTVRMETESKVMGKSLLRANFLFSLAPGNPKTTITGNIKDFNLLALNPMMEPVAFMKIESGHLINLDFDFKYNSEQSDGKMWFEYRDLKIRFINKESGKVNGPVQDVKSFVTDIFVVNNNNLKDDRNFRVGEIQFKRNKKKSIFNYWWKSLLSGFRSSTGVTEKEND